MAQNKEMITVLDGRVKLLQAVEGFRTCLDSVMLGAACPATGNENILDLGCGVGSAGFCVLSRQNSVRLTGIDVQEDSVVLARENARLNGMDGRAVFFHEDVATCKRVNAFHHVICNPPYMPDGAHMKSPRGAKAAAHGMEETSLEDWIACAHRCVKPSGSMTMIHRADMVDKILQAMAGRFGAVEVIPLWPKQGQPAKRVIVRGLRDRKTPAVIHHGLVIHEQSGDYTKEAEDILRKGYGLCLD